MAMLFVHGFNDQNKVSIIPMKTGQFNFKITGSCNVFPHMGFEKNKSGGLPSGTVRRNAGSGCENSRNFMK